MFEAFFGDISQEELESKIRSGKFSIWDRFRLSAMEGDTKLLMAMHNRVFPEKIIHDGAIDVPGLAKYFKNA